MRLTETERTPTGSAPNGPSTGPRSWLLPVTRRPSLRPNRALLDPKPAGSGRGALSTSKSPGAPTAAPEARISSPEIVSRSDVMPSWPSVQASWASIRSITSCERGGGAPSSLMSATPVSETGTESSTLSPVGKAVVVTPSSGGPASSRWTRVLASCSPTGTKTGSGTRIREVGSKK